MSLRQNTEAKALLLSDSTLQIKMCQHKHFSAVKTNGASVRAKAAMKVAEKRMCKITSHDL